jgi:hypothetical protein
MTQTLTRLYDSYDTALQVALALKEAGFTDRDVSLVSSRAATRHAQDATGPAADHAGTGAAVGGIIGAATGLMVGTGVLAIPGIGPVVAAGGLAGGVVGALAGTGTDAEIQVYAESIRRGDTLVTVRVPDDRAQEAARILTSFPFVDVAAREAEYRGAGWQRFDESDQPHTRERRGPVLPSGLP